MKKNPGFTVLELLIVIAIISLLAAIGISSISEFVRMNRIQNQTRRIFSDLSNMRIMAMNTNRTHFMQFAAGGTYTVLEDTNGDQLPSAAGVDTQRLARKEVPFTWSNTDAVYEPVTTTPTGLVPTFDARGYATTTGMVCLLRAGKAETGNITNCIVISPTRLRMGKIKLNGGCSEADCLQQ